jgi:hypothetical protein
MPAVEKRKPRRRLRSNAQKTIAAIRKIAQRTLNVLLFVWAINNVERYIGSHPARGGFFVTNCKEKKYPK